jgi:hypothetical protein
MYAFDIGNSSTVGYNGHSIKSIKSVIASVNGRYNLLRTPGVIVINDLIYHTGVGALKYDMVRLQSESDKTASISESIILLLSALSDFGTVEPTTEIVIQVPELVTSYQHDLVKALNNIYVWEKDRHLFETRLKVVGVYQEGFGSWYLARNSGSISDIGYTVVIDIGGGTVVTTLIENSSGEVMRSSTYPKQGMIYLANLIKHDNEVTNLNNGIMVSVESFFNCLENQTYRIGHTGESIQKYIDYYTPLFWKNIFQNLVLNDYRQAIQNREVTNFLVTGGGAFTVAPCIKAVMNKPGVGKMFLLSPNPLSDNVKGIYDAFHRQQSKN